MKGCEKMLHVQTMMDGLPKPDKQGYDTIADMITDLECPADRKLKLIGQICHFVTLNGVRKDDLHEMLKYVYKMLKDRLDVKY